MLNEKLGAPRGGGHTAQKLQETLGLWRWKRGEIDIDDLSPGWAREATHALEANSHKRLEYTNLFPSATDSVLVCTYRRFDRRQRSILEARSRV